MFAENDVENSIQQNAAVGISSGIGSLNMSANSRNSNSESYLNLDNEEALQKIKTQLCEIKLATSKNANKMNEEQGSSLISTEEDQRNELNDTDETKIRTKKSTEQKILKNFLF
jgi:hypothetical protein